MPTYQYRCTECGEDLESVQKFSDAPLTTCPACGGRLRKVFNAVGVVFKLLKQRGRPVARDHHIDAEYRVVRKHALPSA